MTKLAGPDVLSSASLEKATPLDFNVSAIHARPCTTRAPGPCYPTGIEREDVLLEHALKQPDHAVAIFHDEPVLLLHAMKNREAEFLVKGLRRRDILTARLTEKLPSCMGGLARVVNRVDSRLYRISSKG
jgi:hypothetical protein